MALIYACAHKALGNVLFRFDPPLTRAEYNLWKRAHGLPVYPWESTAADPEPVAPPAPGRTFEEKVRDAAVQFANSINRGRKEQ